MIDLLDTRKLTLCMFENSTMYDLNYNMYTRLIYSDYNSTPKQNHILLKIKEFLVFCFDQMVQKLQAEREIELINC